MTSSGDSMKRGSVRPGPHLSRCTAVVLVVLLFVCVLLLVQFWKVSGIRNDIYDSYALLQQKYQLLAKDKQEIDAKLSETEENVQSIEKKRLKEETDMESKREQLKVDKMKIEQLKSDYESLQGNLTNLRSQLARYEEENQLLKDNLNRSQTELNSFKQQLAEQKQTKDRQVAVNLLALSGNDVLFAGKDNLAAKVVRGNFTTTTPSSTSTLSATSTTSQMPVKTAIIDKATSGGFFAKKIAAQRQLQVKLPTQLSLGQQGVTVEASDTLAKPIGMFDEKKKGGVGGLDDKEGESDSQFIRPNSGVEGRSQPDAKVLPSTNPNPLENGEDKAREQLQVDNTDDQQENQVDS